MNTHVVLKKLPGPNGQTIEAGAEVDASEWRNAPLLVKQRYLKPLDGVVDDGTQYLVDNFEQRVIAAIKKDLLEGGELAQMLTQKLGNQPVIEPVAHARRKSNQS